MLKGKTALVTGASRGIGRAIALNLAAKGARVCVNYRSNAQAAREVVQLILDAGGNAFLAQADVADAAAIADLFSTFDAEADTLDILVNNAGAARTASTSETDEALYDEMMGVNAKGTFLVTRAALSRLQNNGRIINVSSMVSRAAYPSCIAYAMAKAAVNHFTVSLAAELGHRGITVNAVAPGATLTDFGDGLYRDPATVEILAQTAALGRIGQVDDIARTVAFLAGTEGGWITGQVIEASGGMHL